MCAVTCGCQIGVNRCAIQALVFNFQVKDENDVLLSTNAIGTFEGAKNYMCSHRTSIKYQYSTLSM